MADTPRPRRQPSPRRLLAVAVAAAVDLLHLAERRRAPDRQADIYATSGTTHLRQRLTRQHAAALETVTE
jgi:hypothetical protein